MSFTIRLEKPRHFVRDTTMGVAAEHRPERGSAPVWTRRATASTSEETLLGQTLPSERVLDTRVRYSTVLDRMDERLEHLGLDLDVATPIVHTGPKDG